MSKKLLLADDSITIQKVIGITFANEDYDLTIVDNGEAALQKAKSDRPDLILADIFMPGKDGYELCAAVKQDPSLQGLPVLLLTGTFEPFDEDKARNAGADSWIAKPFESQALIERVDELLASAPEPAAAPPQPAAPATLQPAQQSPPPSTPAPQAASAHAAPQLAPAPSASPAEPASSQETIPQDDEWEDTFEFEDDSWGAVSLDEEELGEQVEPATPIGAGETPTASEEEIFDSGGDFGAEEEPFSAPAETEREGDDTFLFEEESFDLGEEPASEGVSMPEEEAFTFDEEQPLVEEGEPVVEAPEPEPEIFSTGSEEETFAFEEEPSASEQEEVGPGAGVDGDEEDVLSLDEVDILEEVDLESPEEEPETAGRAEAAAEAAIAEEEIWGEAAGSMPEPSGEPGIELEEPSPIQRESVEEPASPAPAEPLAEAPRAAVEEKVRSLSDEELSEVVERVAGEVVERLANTILEKIAWEVVPDLAEGLIKEEIRKIKEEMQ